MERAVDLTKRDGFFGAPRLSALLIGLALAFAPGVGTAADQGQGKTVSGLTVYLGMVPAAIVRGHPSRHPEAQAHDGPPRGQHVYHVVVAIFDATSGARVEDAKVSARVSSLGLAGPRRPLEAMRIADTITYGNYFNLPGKGLYHIDVEIERARGAVRFEFSYPHQ